MTHTHMLSAVAGGALAVAGMVIAGLGLTGCASTAPQSPGEKIQASAADLKTRRGAINCARGRNVFRPYNGIGSRPSGLSLRAEDRTPKRRKNVHPRPEPFPTRQCRNLHLVSPANRTRKRDLRL